MQSESKKSQLDVLILAGGHGERLKGIWALSKAVVPIDGVPVIARIYNMACDLRPRVICFALGPGASEIVEAISTWGSVKFSNPIYQVTDPRGVDDAIVRAVRSFNLGSPLLVLNGDTLPLYDLQALVAFSESTLSPAPIAAATREVSATGVRVRRFAGAAILGTYQISALLAGQSFESLIMEIPALKVEDFLDVGTPEGFARAIKYKLGSGEEK